LDGSTPKAFGAVCPPPLKYIPASTI